MRVLTVSTCLSIFGHNTVYTTANAGETWQTQTVWEVSPQLLPISRAELFAGNISLSTLTARLYRSTNGGTSWIEIAQGQVDGGIRNFFQGHGRLWAVGPSATWYYQPPINHPPAFISTPRDTTIYVDSLYQATLAAEDVDGDSIRFVLLEKPNFLQFLENSPSIRRLTFIGRPLASDTGSHAIKVIAHDNRGGADTAAWTLRVLPLVNLPPFFTVHQETLAIRALRDTTIVRIAYDPNRGDTLEPIPGVVASGVSVLPNSQPQHDSTTVFIRIRLDTVNIGQLIHAPVVVRDLGGLRDTLHLYLRVLPVTSVEEVPGQPTEFKLSQNYPNPFNPATKIMFAIPTNEFVTLKVYDILGLEIRTLVSQKLNAGAHTVDFNAHDLASGVYFYQLRTKNFVDLKKLILLR